jgi:hypothetical protein
MNKINTLLEVWEKRPPKVDPDEQQHLLYIFGNLLPALRDAVPDIKIANAVMVTSQARSQERTPAPSTEIPAETSPALERSSHIRTENPSGGDTVGAQGCISGSENKPGAAGDTPAETPVAQTADATPRKRASRKKHASVPPAEPQKTGDTSPP